MVKLGFIVEGTTEKIIVESEAFRLFLLSINLSVVAPVIDATGKNKLSGKSLFSQIQILKDGGANKIIILTDLDEDACITVTKNRIQAPNECLVIVAVKTIEAWFLSDNKLMQKILNESDYVCEHPETISNPYEEIRQLMVQYTGRGVGNSKVLLAKRFVKEGFSIVQAANHPQGSSAQYFIQQLHQLSTSPT
jgi:hypothetical protein